MRTSRLLLAVLPLVAICGADPVAGGAADPRFFGTYCGRQPVRYTVTPEFLGIEGSPREETVMADFMVFAGYSRGALGLGLVHGKGRATADGHAYYFSFSGWVTAPGRATVTVSAPLLGTAAGSLALSADGEAVTVKGLDQQIRLTKDCDNARPSARILSPVSGAGVPWGHEVAFTASASDAEDSAFPRRRMVWTSDRDGVLGYGQRVRKSHLSQGVHRVSFSVTDSGGRTASAEVSLSVLNNPPNAPVIYLPADGSSHPAGPAINLRGRAGDRESGRIFEGGLTWTSDRDGELGEGEHAATPLSLGRHVITLTATDEGGASSSASVGIDVVPCLDNCPPGVEISTPVDYIAIADFECVTATATARDLEDGPLGVGAFTWTTTYFDGSADVTETLPATGGVVELCALATPATDTVHVLSVTVEDSAGLVSEPDSVRIYVIFGGLI